MIQKIIRIGNSAGVIIPKSVLKDNNFRIGDKVEIEIFPLGSRYSERLRFIQKIDDIIKKHGPVFEELSKK